MKLKKLGTKFSGTYRFMFMSNYEMHWYKVQQYYNELQKQIDVDLHDNYLIKLQ